MNAPARLRRAANLTIDSALLDEARALGVNISRACEKGLAKQVAEARIAKWREEHKGAIRAVNAWVEEHGLPLERYRMF